MQITIGCDPEVFVKNSTGKIISAYGLIPGTKASPHAVIDGAVQVDGMALEFNTAPATNTWDFANKTTHVLKQLKKMIPASYGLVVQPVAHFDKEYIEAQPLEARELGCDPDFNAYTGGAPNPKPDGNRPFRTASGHIHIGWTKDVDVTHPDHLEACMMVTKQMDFLLGNLEGLWCPPNERKELYGAKGTFRPKSYGVEYRVLSNAWLKSPKLIRLVADVTLFATQSLLSGKRYYENDRGSEWDNVSNGFYRIQHLITNNFHRDNADAALNSYLNHIDGGNRERVYLK